MSALPVSCRAIPVWLLASALLALSGCAALPERQAGHPPASAEQLQAWETHRERVEAIKDWAFEARAAVRSGMKGGSGRLEWTQVGPVSSLTLSGPFDTGRLALTGTTSRMLITDARGNSRLSSDPEGLLEEMTGWRVPLARLPRWVRGLPEDPLGDAAGGSYRLDDHGRLVRFSERQWTVEYDRYASTDGSPALPHFIEMHDDEVRIRLIIDRWHLEAGE
jgi:outer membrane lipoprotein LolB